jgi:hypothetical protein
LTKIFTRSVLNYYQAVEAGSGDAQGYCCRETGILTGVKGVSADAVKLNRGARKVNDSAVELASAAEKIENMTGRFRV